MTKKIQIMGFCPGLVLHPPQNQAKARGGVSLNGKVEWCTRKEREAGQKKHGHYKNTGFMVQPQESLKMERAASKVPKLPVQEVFK